MAGSSGGGLLQVELEGMWERDEGTKQLKKIFYIPTLRTTHSRLIRRVATERLTKPFRSSRR